jgi:hypothetical protein
MPALKAPPGPVAGAVKRSAMELKSRAAESTKEGITGNERSINGGAGSWG